MILNPVSLLLAWLALALQWLPPSALVAATALTPPIVWRYCRSRVWVLLCRARWLLLSIAWLFALATPGAALPGPAGMLGVTYEGILLAATQVLRLSLLLVLEYVETSSRAERKHWRDWLHPPMELAEYTPLHLTVAPLAVIDQVVMVLALLGLCGVWGWRAGWGGTIE